MDKKIEMHVMPYKAADSEQQVKIGLRERFSGP